MKKNKTQDFDEYIVPDEVLTDAPLSEDEIELIVKAHEGELDRSTLPPHDNSDMAKAKRYVKKNKFTVLFVVITIVLLAAVIGVLAFMLHRSNLGKPSTKDFEVTLGEEEFTMPYKKSVKDGVFYFDMRLIANYAGLVVSGEKENLKFSCADGTYVRFEHSKDTATVNGTRVFLDGTVKITDKTKDSQGECLVPFTFIQKLFSNPTVQNSPGLRAIWNKNNNTVTVRRVVYEETNEPLPISFSPDCFDLAENVYLKHFEQTHPDLAFACVKMTALTNKNNPLDASYTPEGLLSLAQTQCPLPKNDDRDFLLVSNAARALEAMLTDLNKHLDGEEKILVTSAYRSYKYQEKIFEDYVTEYMSEKSVDRKEAEAYVLKTSAPAGKSEHQLGLCVDLIEDEATKLTEQFAKTKAFEWLSQNAFKYGFILRYPKDKEDITKYSYEPWHYRFVGIDAATVIHEDNICLEEYLAKY